MIDIHRDKIPELMRQPHDFQGQERSRNRSRSFLDLHPSQRHENTAFSALQPYKTTIQVKFRAFGNFKKKNSSGF